MSSPLDAINHLVVLMLENRAFYTIFDFQLDAHIDGLGSTAHSNPVDPLQTGSALTAAGPTTPGAIPFDPGHEFDDVHQQFYGVLPNPGPLPAIP